MHARLAEASARAPILALSQQLSALHPEAATELSSSVSTSVDHSAWTPLPQPPASEVSIGAHKLPFPDSLQYAIYLDQIFQHVAPFYPCINENEFRQHGLYLHQPRPVLRQEDTTFLALNYALFATVDVLLLTSAAKSHRQANRKWYKLSESTLARIAVTPPADGCLLQALIIQVSIF